VALVRTDVSKERIAFIIKMIILSELEKTLAVTGNSFLTGATRRHFMEDGIFL
jgi:hypothetical protein